MRIKQALSSTTVRILAAVTSVLLIVGVPTGASATSSPAPTVLGPAITANLAGFSAGNIISDSVFFDTWSMGEAEIQAFLEQKVPACQSGYTCLRDRYDSTRSTPADPMCGPYSGGSRERASTIIYKVAQACGINPQVLLVTLQKEQGLVTHVWPSEWRYTIAMGQGCPDTAACDTTYNGFFNQVYGAARQLKRYANPPGTSLYFTWYAPGRTWNVLYNPNSACGSSPVFIANQATANLYYYTPYQPNAAALNAGYGTGDSCSAYGNRNFYNYFTDWFGSTQTLSRMSVARKAIAGVYASPGVPGEIGGATSPVRCGLVGDGCYQDYQNGVIYSSGSGTYAIRGTVRQVWSANDYERGLGYPTRATQCGLAGGACYQDFQNGVIYASTSGTYAIRGTVREVWIANDYERGLGYPISAVRCGLAGGACYQDFQNGVIYASTSGTYAIRGTVREVWIANDYERGLGYPISAVRCGLAGGACYQDFQNGVIYASTIGTYAITGPIRQVWNANDYERGLGYPISAVRCGLAGGACYQDFQNGVIYASTSGTYAITGPIRQVWNANDYERGLGYPISARRCGLAGGACYQDFQNGVIYTSTSGTYPITGPIRQVWNANDYERGLGYPTSSQRCDSETSKCEQSFERGVIRVDDSGATVVE
ncbi:LGFP repeat-containing protein [Microbacterium ulmi]|uniref:LGFP repeat-containing protein n=3 Tax=Microbacterium ulmi TaxID=179095 RepID=A0A7Y2LZ30_9MICO|nr:hypothetical protein [Microbacterium ulmi]NNH03397.1 hypothetical protein [Microbacterium ulmi]